MNTPQEVLHICKVLRENGHEAWLVGGAVRDAMLGREAHDWDVATSAHPESVVKLFPRVIETGIKHGTVTVLHHGQSYEVTTYRGDGAYSDGRRPDDVKFLKTIEEDLARRDFTVNAIAYDPIGDRFCDPYDGEHDLWNNTIRAVGDPYKRFAEDGLRVLRAARFASTLEFEVEAQTLAAIRGSLDTLAKVSIERVHDEWLKAMGARDPSVAFNIMAETGMLMVIAPELLPMLGCEQNRYHAFDVWQHTMAVVNSCPPSDPILRMAALLHDIGKPVTRAFHTAKSDYTFYDHEITGAAMANEFMARMRFSLRERERVTHLVRHHFIRYETGGDWSDSAVRRWVRRVGPEHVESLFTLARADIAGKGPAPAADTKLECGAIDELQARIAELSKSAVTSTKALCINGTDVLQRLGCAPGPVVGRMLAALLEKVLDDPSLNTRESLLELVDALGPSV